MYKKYHVTVPYTEDFTQERALSELNKICRNNESYSPDYIRTDNKGNETWEIEVKDGIIDQVSNIVGISEIVTV